MMKESNQTESKMIKHGITLLPLGLFFLLSGLGRSGWIWDGYTAWQPISFIGAVLLTLLIAFPLYKKHQIPFRLSSDSEEVSLKNISLLTIVVVGLPIISVSTRQLALPIDPFSLYAGLVVCGAILYLYGVDIPLLLFSLIYFAGMLIPSLDQQLIGSNHLNENMLQPFIYNLKMGLFLISWGSLSLYRKKHLKYEDVQLMNG